MDSCHRFVKVRAQVIFRSATFLDFFIYYRIALYSQTAQSTDGSTTAKLKRDQFLSPRKRVRRVEHTTPHIHKDFTHINTMEFIQGA